MSVGHDPASLRVIWHDLECGAYSEDLEHWRALAAQYGDPVLDVGAGTGRTTIDLAEHGHTVTALDCDQALIEELRLRAAGLPVQTIVGDAREFALEQRFGLIVVPMQTIQLLGGPGGRQRFLARAAGHLRPGGAAAVAISEKLECFSLEAEVEPPTPDMRELDGVLYSSQPTAVRPDGEGFVLERSRERVGPRGERTVEPDQVRLDRLTAAQLEREAVTAGLRPLGRRVVPATEDYVGSVVVVLGA